MNNYRRYLIGTIVFVFCILSSSTFSSELISKEKLLELVSQDLIEKCNSGLKQLENDPDSVEMAFPMKCAIRDNKIIEYQGKKYYIVIAGCTGYGEVLIINSTDTSVIAKSEIINFPTHYVSIGEIIDINNDSVPELVIHQSSGSQGMYAIFFSLYETKLLPILNEIKHYQFYASGGNIEYKDIDNDGTLEIILESMLLPADVKKGITEATKEILKWDGTRYIKNDYL